MGTVATSTRGERKNVTRGRLLEAAEKVFLRRGFRNASVEEIAAEAGHTTGAVYSNFDGKDDLFFTILEERQQRRLAELRRQVEAGDDPAANVGAWFSAVIESQRQWLLLIAESWSHAARDPKLRPRFAARHRRARKAIGELVERAAAERGIKLPIPAQDVGTILIALANGFALERISARAEIPESLFGQALAFFFGGLAAAARNGTD
jgi:AcrR family transcriptional regulator